MKGGDQVLRTATEMNIQKERKCLNPSGLFQTVQKLDYAYRETTEIVLVKNSNRCLRQSHERNKILSQQQQMQCKLSKHSYFLCFKF